MEETKEQPSNGGRKTVVLRIAAVFIIAGAAWGGWWWTTGRFYEFTDDAYVAGNLVSITPQAAGTVTAILADNTDFVKEGDPLIRLDDTDAKIALEKASNELAVAVSQAGNALEGVKTRVSRLAMREADLEKAKSDYGRRKQLFAEHAITQEAFDHSRIEYENAQVAVTAARHELAEAQIAAAGNRAEDNPHVALAKTKVREAFVALRRMNLRAPVSGFVARRAVQLGERAIPGKPLMAVVPVDGMSAEANFKENQLKHMRAGQPVEIVSDIYGKGVRFHGTVVGIGAGTGSVFSVLPAQNATGNWIKVVQRVPVKISIPADELKKNPLVVGLSLAVTVDIHESGGNPLQPGTAKHALSTAVYDADQAGADELIAGIIATNLKTAQEARR
ncbi:MAG: HlyD family efflux transporter periplasmic adaptor subunit [Candidatus Nitrosotenuis sp.]|nr:MAG: HlyD family efflux transporter periplasmic adaptor subunit [Candidatus Nitrosotenuis sp.]